ncbi:unnamed protein product [Knipowitschia caucasica]|uniref:Solute carrier organic anion transporter family member n=1 Tax=Knipowitschia caucasica TaxID=637954 RepID=A0AAV2J5J0_KNICA
MAAAGAQSRSLFRSVKFFVLCHSVLQLSQLLVSGYMKSSISTIERRFGLSSQKAGLLAAFNEVGNTVLIVFVSFCGSRVHRPRFIAGGAAVAAGASLLMTLPHFLYGPYEYTGPNHGGNGSGLCLTQSSPSPPVCDAHTHSGHEGAYPLLLLAQLLLGIGAVPIQPFGISYIDDFSSKRNSPLYLGILLAVTSIGPALGFMTSAFTLRLYVDFNSVKPDQVSLKPGDLRWVGAWWLGFLLASCLLLLTALPLLFFPRELPPETGSEKSGDDVKQDKKNSQTLGIFLRSFPRTALRTLRSPVYMCVVLAQVNLAALLCGLATFMPKFMERQFSQSTSTSNMMIGGVALPCSILGIVLGGVLMRRAALSTVGAGRMCLVSVSLCVLTAVPLLLIGCSSNPVYRVYPAGGASPVPDPVSGPVCKSCLCQEDWFNPVCGSDRVEFRSPCHAGCTTQERDQESGRIYRYTNCSCISASPPATLSPDPSPSPSLAPSLGPDQSWARPGSCGSPCSHLISVFMVFVALTCFIASFCHTPSYILILRSVPVDDKSFAVGLQYMFFRVLAFMPGPVLYGKVIDTTCLLWGKKCNRLTSCLYYDMDLFRTRFLGLQLVFFCGSLFCFLLMVWIQRRKQKQEKKTRYELTEQTPGLS